MTRFSDEYDGTEAEWAFHEANVRRALNGKHGQKNLREIEQALLAMPDKRLCEGALQEPDGLVCVIGAYGLWKGLELPKGGGDYWSTIELGLKLGMTGTLTHEIASTNDADYVETPEERYWRVLGWVRSEIKETI